MCLNQTADGDKVRKFGPLYNECSMSFEPDR
jgi:hypothetical protein